MTKHLRPDFFLLVDVRKKIKSDFFFWGGGGGGGGGGDEKKALKMKSTGHFQSFFFQSFFFFNISITNRETGKVNQQSVLNL